MADEKQLAILRRGGRVWDAWRQENPEVWLDLTAVDLNGASLLGTDFATADLTGAYIYGFAAWEGNLTGATQTNLILTYTDEPVIREKRRDETMTKSMSQKKWELGR